MRLEAIQTAVKSLSESEIWEFSRWFESYLADAWDRRFEADMRAGLLDRLGKEVDADFNAGRCSPLFRVPDN